ncbi:MAG: hypothetical protein ACYCPH_00560 [Minisyncoccota bacterium]
MTWSKATPVLVVCLIFDALRFMFEQFWFFGPLFIGVGTSALTGGGTLGHIAGTVVGGAAGIFGAGAIEIIGVVMAMAVGFLGWMTVALMLMLTDARIFKENASNSLWMLFSLGISEVPLVGTVPVLTATIWKMYHTQIKKEKKALKQYEQEQAAERRQEQEQAAEQVLEALQTRAAEENAEMATSEENDDGEEIPEDVRETA